MTISYTAIISALISTISITDNKPLENTQPLTVQGDLAELMVAGIDKFLMRQIEEVKNQRKSRWNRDFSSPENYIKSVEPNRQRLKKIIGVVDPREKPVMQLLATTSQPALIGESDNFKITAVKWNVLNGVDAEGLLLEPKDKPLANVIALSDCDWTPEMLVGLIDGIPKSSQFARILAESGCRVLVPLLMDRSDEFSGIPEVRMVNQPHREFIYRASYELGRHIIGYEVQKVFAGVDWFANENNSLPIGIIGYGEGGLIAFYSSAVDTRIGITCISGYFQPREKLWQEPIYRNVWSLLYEFGDAEIASLIAPRTLIIEHCDFPKVSGPPQPLQGRSGGAAPGIIVTPSFDSVKSEFERACELVKPLDPNFDLIKSENDQPVSQLTLKKFINYLNGELKSDSNINSHLPKSFNPRERLKRQYQQLIDHTQYLMRESEFRRAEFWSKADATDVSTWEKTIEWYREYLHNEVVGYSPLPDVPISPKTRCVYETEKFKGYEVTLDIYPEVFAYGILLVPKDVKNGERRPVVVCQHGLEGRPQDVADPSVNNESYHQFACKLAERGFITYAPQNPYIGGDNFRVLVRKAHPIKQSLYSVIVRQHERTIEWLSSLPFVDKDRIAFYGLSYGGKTAMRIPAIVKGYCLSICSADFNEWIWKNASVRHPYSYMITGEYEMFEFDLGNTFNYSELSGLICPRPFMVERGHFDGVAPDEWVAYEYAKTKRRYDLLGLGNLTEMEVFNGPHTINGVGTFEFLHRHLNWRKKT
ncbi:MAG: alpha/beta hydrolase family protein [Candidatus Poribacteria bacterium]